MQLLSRIRDGDICVFPGIYVCRELCWRRVYREIARFNNVISVRSSELAARVRGAEKKKPEMISPAISNFARFTSALYSRCQNAVSDPAYRKVSGENLYFNQIRFLSKESWIPVRRCIKIQITQLLSLISFQNSFLIFISHYKI